MLHIVRISVFAVAILFSLIVLGLAANFTAESQQYYGVTFDFAALGIATAVLTIVTLPAMLIVEMLRDGAFTSMIVVELPWLFVLWVLWLATAADTTPVFDSSFTFRGSCSDIVPIYLTICHELQALIAFSYLTWLVLMAYFGIVLVMSIIAANRGQNPWTSSVKDAGFFGAGAGAGAAPPAPFHNAAPAPAMQQHQYPPTTVTTPETQGHVMV